MNLVTDEATLRLPCKKISLKEGLKLGRHIHTLLLKFNKTFQSRQGCGLAAPQIGVHSRVCVILLDKLELILVNPMILETSTVKILNRGEGCLSFPGKTVDTYRWLWVKVRTDNFGERIFGPQAPSANAQKQFMESVVVQHEIDHLDGKLIFDRVHDDTISMDSIISSR